MACLANWNLRGQHSIAKVYTFGQPRVGNAAFASTYEGVAEEFRVVHYAGEQRGAFVSVRQVSGGFGEETRG